MCSAKKLILYPASDVEMLKVSEQVSDPVEFVFFCSGGCIKEGKDDRIEIRLEALTIT